MQTIKKMLPVLFSPRFWGIVATVILVTLTEEGVLSEAVGYAIATVFGASTGVNIVDKFATKINNKE